VALDEIELPHGAELTEQRTGGNMLCFDVCPSADRRYVVDAEQQEFIEHLRGELRAAGYDLEDATEPDALTTELQDRRLYITGRVEPREDGPGVDVRLRAVSAG